MQQQGVVHGRVGRHTEWNIEGMVRDSRGLAMLESSKEKAGPVTIAVKGAEWYGVACNSHSKLEDCSGH